MRTTTIPGLGNLPVIGQGTYRMGERRSERSREIDALRLGFSLGMTLVDTAEFYGVGGAEEMLGEAIRDCRDEVFVVTKIWPSHADERGLLKALGESLRRLHTDHVDLTLLHWPTRSVPLGATLRGLRAAQEQGLTRHIGVSNFDLQWLSALAALEERPGEIAANEIPYSLVDRRAEVGVLQEASVHNRLILAYSPLAHGRAQRYADRPGIRRAADEIGCSPQEVALAWVVRQAGVVAIPKAVSPEHVQANARAGDIVLGVTAKALLDVDFRIGRRSLHPELPPYRVVHSLAFGAFRLQRRLRGS